MIENRFLRSLEKGPPSIGCFLSIGDAYSAEVLAHCGFDWLCVDLQHGMFGIETCIAMLQGISTTDVTPLVRVPGPDPSLIGKVLDAGPLGVILPSVEDPQTASSFVAATRYPPRGRRSLGPARARLFGGEGYVAESDSQIARIVMVESREAVRRISSIVTVDGIHGVLIGTADLAMDFGLDPSEASSEDDFLEAVNHVTEGAGEAGISVGIFVESWEHVGLYAGKASFFALGVDARLMAAGAREQLTHSRHRLR